MIEQQLKTHIWVQGFIALCREKNLSAFVLYKGEKDIGSLLVKIALGNKEAIFYIRTRDFDGQFVWHNPLGSLHQKIEETQVDTYIKQAKIFDTDLWVIEVEDFQDSLSGSNLEEFFLCL